jgi:hypothetical protein
MTTMIVFAPGWGDPSIVIDRLAARFEGVDKLVLSYHNRGMTSHIADTINSVKPIVRILRENYETLIFIGHSMGGLVGRSLDYLLEDHGWGFWDTYISIASPHQGTKLASLGNPFLKRLLPSITDMRPGSRFLDYKYDICTPERYSIQAQFDELLFPQSSAVLPNAKEHVIIPGTNHLTVATSKKTFEQINTWLGW